MMGDLGTMCHRARSRSRSDPPEHRDRSHPPVHSDFNV